MPVSPQPAVPSAVVFDLEFTAWEGSWDSGWNRPGEYKELLQIGAVKVDAGFGPLAQFDRIVRPRLNSELSGFIQRLIGLSNDDVRTRGVDFVTAYRDFADFAEGLPAFSFGRDDRVFADNIRLYGLKDLPLLRYYDLRPWLTAQGIDIVRPNFHACDVGPAAGVPFRGHQHNGLADASSVAEGVAALMARGAPWPGSA